MTPQPDIDWDDPDFTGYPGITETTGDVADLRRLIMDTEHHEDFEIHPVRAYYVVASNSLGEDEPVPGGQRGPGRRWAQLRPNPDHRCRCPGDVRHGRPGRGGDSDDVIYVESTRALSFGTTTHYAGGGTMRDRLNRSLGGSPKPDKDTPVDEAEKQAGQPPALEGMQ